MFPVPSGTRSKKSWKKRKVKYYDPHLPANAERRADLLSLREQFRDRSSPSGYADQSGSVALWLKDKINLWVRSHRQGDTFIWWFLVSNFLVVLSVSMKRTDCCLIRDNLGVFVRIYWYFWSLAPFLSAYNLQCLHTLMLTISEVLSKKQLVPEISIYATEYTRDLPN